MMVLLEQAKRIREFKKKIRMDEIERMNKVYFGVNKKNERRRKRDGKEEMMMKKKEETQKKLEKQLIIAQEKEGERMKKIEHNERILKA
jgi:spore cortex formation protein SpoVR/YcgB (stage V sporulation)